MTKQSIAIENDHTGADAESVLAQNCALFLDFDGTLVDIAPTPDAVHVPAMLPDLLNRLSARLHGALAIVSGRSIVQIEHFFPNAQFVLACEHGALIRYENDSAVENMLASELPETWFQRVSEFAERFPGSRVEKKRFGLVVHFRGCPAASNVLLEEAHLIIADDSRFCIRPALMAWEIRPKGCTKGDAVRTLSARSPFKGRLPIFVGDDETDQDGIRAARALGGRGYFVPDDFQSPREVRAWITRFVGS